MCDLLGAQAQQFAQTLASLAATLTRQLAPPSPVMDGPASPDVVRRLRGRGSRTEPRIVLFGGDVDGSAEDREPESGDSCAGVQGGAGDALAAVCEAAVQAEARMRASASGAAAAGAAQATPDSGVGAPATPLCPPGAARGSCGTRTPGTAASAGSLDHGSTLAQCEGALVQLTEAVMRAASLRAEQRRAQSLQRAQQQKEQRRRDRARRKRLRWLQRELDSFF